MRAGTVREKSLEPRLHASQALQMKKPRRLWVAPHRATLFAQPSGLIWRHQMTRYCRNVLWMRIVAAFLLFSVLAVTPSMAEQATYGEVDLLGLAKKDWPLNPPGKDNTMVCNVKGRNGSIAIHAGPGTEHPINRKLKRLAIVVVDNTQRSGPWVKVVTAHREHTPEGKRQRPRKLHVTGWAHTGFLCAFHD